VRVGIDLEVLTVKIAVGPRDLDKKTTKREFLNVQSFRDGKAGAVRGCVEHDPSE
jgi:hypothetical protein